MPILFNPNKKKGVFMIPTGGTQAISCAFSYSAASYTDADPDPTPTVTGTSGGTFTSTAGIVINADTGEIDLSASTLNTYVVTYTVGAKACTQSVEITASFSNTKSLAFDGVDDYVNISNVFALGITSISFWMKSTDTAHGGVTLGLGNLTFVATTPLIRLGSNNYKYFADQVANFDGNWHHWFFYITGSDQADIADAKMYVDGSEIAAGTIVSSGLPSAWTVSQIGNAPWGGNKAALIDEFAIWQSDQTANVGTIYGGGTPINLTSLNPVAWYRMGDGDVFPTLTDHGSGGNSGTMTNMDAGDIVEDVPS